MGEVALGSPEAISEPSLRRRLGLGIVGVLGCLIIVVAGARPGGATVQEVVPAAPPPPLAPATTDVYTGTMTIAIDYLDACFGSLGVGRYQHAATVVIKPPERFVNEFGALVVENNPVSLEIGAGGETAEGAIDIDSAAIIGPGQLTNRAIFQYWQLARSGNSLSGTLVEDHAEESVALNLLNASKLLIECRPQLGFIPWVEAIAQGTTLSGTVTATSVDLTVTGNVSGLNRPFAARIVASRPK